MSKFESSVKQIAAPQQKVYGALSDLRFIQKMIASAERIKDKIPADQQEAIEKMKDLTVDADSVAVTAPMVGEVKMTIVERDEPKMIKFQSEKSPIPLTFWIQILPVTDETSKIRLTVDADLPFFLKGMAQKPLSEGIEKVADALTIVPYNSL